MAKIGYNIQAQALSGSEKDALVGHLRRVRPTLLVVIDEPQYAGRLAQELPDTVIFHRRFNVAGDGVGDDNIQDRMTPAQFWMSATTGLPRLGNLGIYVNNEPRFDDGVVDWLEAVGNLAAAAGRACVLGNWSMGSPADVDALPRAEKLMRLSQNNAGVWIGLHEYAVLHWIHTDSGNQPPPGATPTEWYMGRWKFWRRAMAGIDAKFAITEWGFDDPLHGGVFAGQFKAADRWTQWGRFDMESFAYEQLVEAYRAHYSDPAVLGMALFTYGYVQDIWRDFDYRRMPVFLRKLEGLLDDVPAPMPSPPAPLPPGEGSEEPEPTPPAPVPGPGDGTRRRIEYAGRLNFRSDAGLGKPVLDVLDNGDVVTLTGQIAQADGYTWVSVTHEGQAGWIALVKGLRLPDAESPAPAPVPGIQVTMRMDGETYTGLLTRQGE